MTQKSCTELDSILNGLHSHGAPKIAEWGYFPYRGKGRFVIHRRLSHARVVVYECSRRQAERALRLEYEQDSDAMIAYLKRFKETWSIVPIYQNLTHEERRAIEIDAGMRTLAQGAWL